MDHKASYWERLSDGRVKCLLCPVGCKLDDGKDGICMGRKNSGGGMIATNYGEIVSINIDPIEKKPLYHFHPGDPVLSVGPNGCNLSCKNCQNWAISQAKQATSYVPPDVLADTAVSKSSPGIAYTYSEPLIWFEYLVDAAAAAHDRGLYNVCVTNGYINPDPLQELVSLIDAVNVDVKSIRPEFYRRICKGKLETVTATVESCFGAGVHVEITNLLIPGLNDSEDDVRDLTSWISGISPEIPLHLSRYFPSHKMDIEATPVSSLKRALDIAKDRLTFVYVGNVDIDGTTDTHCPSCGNRLVERTRYRTRLVGIRGNECDKCGAPVPIAM